MQDKEQQLKIVRDLYDYDHAFIDAEGAEHFSKPFGFKARTYIHKANPSAFKGLTLAGGAKSAKGIGAHELAQQICDHLGVKYKSTFGRGSQLRECLGALEQWLQS